MRQIQKLDSLFTFLSSTSIEHLSIHGRHGKELAEKIYTTGCYDQIEYQLKQHMWGAIGAGAGVGILIIILIIAACYQAKKYRKNKDSDNSIYPL